MREECRSFAQAAESDLATMATGAEIEQFCERLGMMMADGMDPVTAEARIKAATMMRVPRCIVVSRDTLDAAGRKFPRFFPSYGELAAFFDERTSDLRAKANRAHAILRDDEMPDTRDEQYEARAAMERVREKTKPRGPWGEGLRSWNDIPVETIKAKWSRFGGEA